MKPRLPLTIEQRGRRLAALIATIASVQFALNALEKVVSESVIVALWVGAAIGVATVTFQIERHRYRQSRM